MAGSGGNAEARFQECDGTEVTAGTGASPGPRIPSAPGWAHRGAFIPHGAGSGAIPTLTNGAVSLNPERLAVPPSWNAEGRE